MTETIEKINKLFKLSESPYKEEGYTALDIARKIMCKNNFAEKEEYHPLIIEYLARYLTLGLKDGLYAIDDAQPEGERLGHKLIDEKLQNTKDPFKNIDISKIINEVSKKYNL